MTSPARRERSALCDTFETVGPDAPTLCSPWRTRDLAAHLVIREGRPDAALGMLVPPLAERAQRVQDGYAAQPWPELVERVRTGPPSWSPTRLEPVDTVVNLAECSSTTRTCCAAAAAGSRARCPTTSSGALVDADAHRPAAVPPLARGRGAGHAHARPPAGPHAPRVPARSSCAAPPASCSCTPRAGSRVAQVDGRGRPPTPSPPAAPTRRAGLDAAEPRRVHVADACRQRSRASRGSADRVALPPAARP